MRQHSNLIRLLRILFVRTYDVSDLMCCCPRLWACCPNFRSNRCFPHYSEITFFGLISQSLKLRYNCHDNILICISEVHNPRNSTLHSFHGLMLSINWPACHCMGHVHSSDGRALQREHRGHGCKSRRRPEISCFFGLISQLLKLRYNCDDQIFIPFVFPQFTIHLIL